MYVKAWTNQAFSTLSAARGCFYFGYRSGGPCLFRGHRDRVSRFEISECSRLPITSDSRRRGNIHGMLIFALKVGHHELPRASPNDLPLMRICCLTAGYPGRDKGYYAEE